MCGMSIVHASSGNSRAARAIAAESRLDQCSNLRSFLSDIPKASWQIIRVPIGKNRFNQSQSWLVSLSQSTSLWNSTAQIEPKLEHRINSFLGHSR